MKLNDLLSNLPSPAAPEGSAEERRGRLISARTSLVVVDDDPTGTQTVHGISVYMDWSVETLVRALSSEVPVFYISTNSRALDSADARAVNTEVGRNLRKAAGIADRKVVIASRSDSTLRGYFPLEIDALTEGLEEEFDGILLAPAFFEAGRHTIDDIHWVDSGTSCIRADQTEFAKDPVFGYIAQTMPEWVEEKSGGRWKAADVRSVPLDIIRNKKSEGVLQILMAASGTMPMVVNAACYEDLGIVADALGTAEMQGKKFIYRCAASFVKVVGGFEEKPLLSSKELAVPEGPGLIVAGSYVGKTSRQLNSLSDAGLAVFVELHADSFESEQDAEKESKTCSERINSLLKEGKTVVLHTSRKVYQSDSADFLKYGNRIMTGLCSVVKALTVRPSFVIAKGGITSLEIARTGLGVKEAFVKGQIAKGVPVWKTGNEAKWPAIDYVVFPGNVGSDETLTDVVSMLINNHQQEEEK